MELRLRRIEQRVGPQVHLYPLDLQLVPLAVPRFRCGKRPSNSHGSSDLMLWASNSTA